MFFQGGVLKFFPRLLVVALAVVCRSFDDEVCEGGQPLGSASLLQSASMKSKVTTTVDEEHLASAVEHDVEDDSEQQPGVPAALKGLVELPHGFKGSNAAAVERMSDEAPESPLTQLPAHARLAAANASGDLPVKLMFERVNETNSVPEDPEAQETALQKVMLAAKRLRLLAMRLRDAQRLRELGKTPMVVLIVGIVFCVVIVGLEAFGLIPPLLGKPKEPSVQTQPFGALAPVHMVGPGARRRSEAVNGRAAAPHGTPAAVPGGQFFRHQSDTPFGGSPVRGMLGAPVSSQPATSLPAVTPPDPTQGQSTSASLGQTQLGAQEEPEAGAYLCPGLVVPEECEVTLRLPRLDPKLAMSEATVDDTARVPVFRVVYCLPSKHEPSSEEAGNRCLTITSSSDERTIFAFCRPGLSGALTILDSKERPFGLIRARVGGRSGYEVATRSGSQITLGINEDNELAAMDRRGRTLALTEAIRGNYRYRLLRIGPFVDAGLVTLAVLAIDLIEGPPA
mmetsp:Transcript_47360/g.126752  ORF Transcript_47360/g.126752 Transcript_47360/m.126752 type:complete len:510 (-) Transcript_47360:51-1580(-)|eukprot:CAMPEP_0171212730 /NCGR_PEP_ID=MMETSP0790-20130122/30281_1 /TAXON_ID=2925 /ORGANISM="Alexandrium catenella, Strain OF101" /LENGTH=509 /DNA_ID=CAMNT_0011678419 /DNA_START=121 /DNA_END=1650 /DNA_ORIENTATION=-